MPTLVATPDPDDWNELRERFSSVLAVGTNLMAQMATLFEQLEARHKRVVNTGEHIIEEIEAKIDEYRELADDIADAGKEAA